MIHQRQMRGSPLESGPAEQETSRHRERFAALEASLSAVRRAKRAADDSLRRAQDAPQPHVTTNSIFVALWEAHLGDWEALFAAMRLLDEAREALEQGTRESGGDSAAVTAGRQGTD